MVDRLHIDSQRGADRSVVVRSHPQVRREHSTARQAALQLAEWEAQQSQLERKRWSLSALLMLLCVAGLIVALHRRPTRPLLLPPPAMPIVVSLSPAPTSSTPPSAQPPGPRQQESPKPQPQKAPQTPKVDSPTPSEIALPPQESSPDETQSIDQPPAAQTSAPAGEDAPISEQAAAPIQGAQSLATATNRLSYEQLLLGQLQRFKRYPHVSQMRRQQGVPYVRFRIDRKGQVLDASLERSSGHAALDAEAVDLPSRASPLPPPPDEVPGDPLEIVVPIEFFLKR